MQRNTLFVGLVAAVVAAAGGLVSYWVADRGGRERIALGRSIYFRHCAVCHGAELEGQPDWQTPLPSDRLPAPPHDESGHTWHHSDQELFTITKKGLAAVVPDYESDMPAFQTILSDDEIAAVLDYIKSTWPRREREYQGARGQAAQ